MKRLFVFLPFILFIMISCHDHETLAEIDELKVKAELEEQNKELLINFYAELDSIESDELTTFIDKFVSSAFVLHLSGAQDIVGKEGLEAYYASSKENFSGITHTVEDVIAEGDKVAFRATSRGKQLGELIGIQLQDIEIGLKFTGFWEVRDGKIVQWWSEYDALGAIPQRGIELQMGE